MDATEQPLEPQSDESMPPAGSILLFNVHRITYDSLKMVTEPGSLLGLAAFLEQHGWKTQVFQGEPSRARNFLSAEMDKNPVLAVGFYCDFENPVEVRQMSRWATEEFGIPVVLGGPQVGGFDADFLRESGCLAAVLGEGEIPLLRLLGCLFRTGAPWKGIEGLVYRDETGQLVRNPPGALLSNLDELPLPAIHRWVNKPFRTKAHILTGRGCPFNCAFCHEGSLSRPVRLRGVPHVLAELDALLAKEPDLKYIAFADDTFITSPRRVREFCRGIAERRQTRNFVWYCEGHVKYLSRWPEILPDMVEAGMVRLQTGIESGLQEVLDIYNKKTTLEEIERVVASAAAAGVHQLVGFFITGGAFENKETLEHNKAFSERLIELAPGVVELGPSPLMPYPDTDIARNPSKYGIRFLDPDGLTTLSDYPVNETETMSREQIAMAQQELVQHVIRCMRQAYTDGKIPHERILHCFQDLTYGAVSLWHTAVYSVLPFVRGYYTLLARGAVRRSQDIPESELDGWRPQRIMEMWHDMDFTPGYPRIGRQVLSPLEFELLLYSTGKLRLREVRNRVYPRFADNFSTRAEFDSLVDAILQRFEAECWLAYAPL